jgi:TRAP-type C4-dicarboxylate transport system permease small subunit
MRTLLDRLFAAAGYLAGLFLIGTLLAVLASIFGRVIPGFDLPGADAYAGYCTATAAFLALADAEPGPLRCFLDMDDAFAHVRRTLKDEE